MFLDFRIAAALINTFRDPLRDHLKAADIIREINQRVDLPNNLADYVIDNNVNRQRAAFRTSLLKIHN